MIDFGEVHKILLLGEKCVDCEFRTYAHGLRECQLIVHQKNPELCRGVDAVAASGISTADTGVGAND